ncbi:MAG: 23S rRNA (uracil(1939)-C(5))-methyltransferase RlmD [Leptotrichiaceae bacterium]|nr:23S rRNA (uracil(1939)-C(5))-methyltransferase RlmD [Leptotrichiaceae bacterium]
METQINNEQEQRKKYTLGQKVEIEIEKIVFGGEGLGRVDGFTIFVPMSVPGDKLEVEIISLKKSYGRGLITKIIEPSKDRIDDIKKMTFEDFDGCDFGMLKYEKQIKYKNEMLREVLEKIGGINLENVKIEEILECSVKTNYRNKTSEPIYKKDGKIMTGFYSKKSHDIFSANENLLRSKISEKIIDKFLYIVNSYCKTSNEFKVYNEKENTGFLKHIIVRNNEKNEVMIVIVINKKSQYRLLTKVLEKLYDENNEVKSVYISIKNESNNVILGEEIRHVFGEKYLEEEIEGIKFKIYPDSFFQINKNQTVKLYKKAIEYLGESKDKTIIDAFSGTGTIAMILSKDAKKVIGIESVESSVVSGNFTIKENNLNNVLLLNGKVETFLPNILKKESVGGIVFDPPRKGIDEKTLKSVVKNKIEKIVYISCNPSTFARDCKFLIENGYKLEKIGAVDMFPQTSHIECVSVMTKVK